MKSLRNLWMLFAILLLTVVVGMVGLHWIEGWPWFDCYYMVLTTFTTIGYGETHPLSHAGRVFNSCVIVVGVAEVFLIIGALTQALIEFEFQEVFDRRKMERQIAALKNHYIICGEGRVGRSVARELARRPAPFVVIENNADKQARGPDDWTIIRGDATQESVLRQARIECAAGLVAAASTDAINTYIVLTARSLNPKLKIIARSSEEDAEKHLKAAGADAVVSPYSFSGWRIAHAFLRPNVVSFLETTMTQQDKYGLELEEINIHAASRFANQSLRDSNIRSDYNVILLAIKSPNQPMRFNPKPDDVIHAGDQIIVMGEVASLRELEAKAAK